MADEGTCRQELSYKHMKESTGNNADIDFHCINCEKLKFELQQVKLEIASYAAIVRLMQQENSSNSCFTRKRMQAPRKKGCGVNKCGC